MDKPLTHPRVNGDEFHALLARELSLTYALRGAPYHAREKLREEIAKCRAEIQPWRENNYAARHQLSA